mmetsp:Transcript_2186/g.5458  ORF Transcript_2186/g.5458 Transcript_2186/m.5458 type:complete len:253 (-) Transcript_2186:1140-1898(-)
MERALERKLQGANTAAERAAGPLPGGGSTKLDKAKPPPEQADSWDDAAPICVEDAIPRILTYAKQRDYFRCLELPQPSCDEINRPVWSCTSSDISRGYRSISKFVHPDKNPHPMAREAFEALNLAVRCLRDPNQLETLMKEAAERAREERDRRAGGGDVHTRITERMNFKQRERELQREESTGFDAKIKAQMRERQDRFKRKKAMASSSRYRRAEEEAEEAAAGTDEEEAEAEADRRRRAAAKAKRKPKMIF